MTGYALNRFLLLFKWLTLKREWYADEYQRDYQYSLLKHMEQIQEEKDYEEMERLRWIQWNRS